LRTHKQSGGYKYLYAKRKLNCDETAKAREDLQNLYCQLVLDEKVYIETLGKLEQGLTFVGILNMKDILREGAKEFISNCKLGNIKVNMLSGDDKNKCLTVAKQVEMIEPKTGYTEFHFKDEDDGVVQFRRVFKEIEKFNKSEASEKKKQEEAELVHEFIESINQEAEKEVLKEAPAETNFDIKRFPDATVSYPPPVDEKVASNKSRRQSLVITKKNNIEKNSPSYNPKFAYHNPKIPDLQGPQLEIIIERHEAPSPVIMLPSDKSMASLPSPDKWDRFKSHTSTLEEQVSSPVLVEKLKMEVRSNATLKKGGSQSSLESPEPQRKPVEPLSRLNH
jgi:hypothetical protein